MITSLKQPNCATVEIGHSSPVYAWQRFGCSSIFQFGKNPFANLAHTLAQLKNIRPKEKQRTRNRRKIALFHASQALHWTRRSNEPIRVVISGLHATCLNHKIHNAFAAYKCRDKCSRITRTKQLAWRSTKIERALERLYRWSGEQAKGINYVRATHEQSHMTTRGGASWPSPLLRSLLLGDVATQLCLVLPSAWCFGIRRTGFELVRATVGNYRAHSQRETHNF